MITKEEAEALEYVDAPDRYATPAYWADKRLDVLAAGLRRREEQVEKMEKSLRAVQWIEDNTSPHPWCPWCLANKRDGHDSDCWWLLALPTPPEPIKTEGA